MIQFESLDFAHRAEIHRHLMLCTQRGCEYSFNNMYLWGRQRYAFVGGMLIFFCQYHRRSVYTYPVGFGDKKAALEAIMEDAAQRGIPCRLSGLMKEECDELERLFPGKFRVHCDRDSFDYVYHIDDLADLKGRKYQKKRNHTNRFRQNYPNHILRPLDDVLLSAVSAMVENWYEDRILQDPHTDIHMERSAMRRALNHWEELGMEGLVLLDGGKILAVTMGGFLTEDTFDVNFEKALADADGAYPTINQEFARYLRGRYPRLRYLNREDDMGLEGLRKAKESYCPDHMVEKYWVCLLEDGCDY